jgi:hypothetical protein
MLIIKLPAASMTSMGILQNLVIEMETIHYTPTIIEILSYPEVCLRQAIAYTIPMMSWATDQA